MTPTRTRRQDLLLVFLLALVMLVADQAVKIAVKTHMTLYESIRVFNWFHIYFTENNGMAFGMELVGKLALTLGRLVAVGVLIWYVLKIAGKRFPKGYMVAMALVIAGALGNIFDSLFYGLIFSESTPYAVAQLVPFGQGYTTLFHGKVVDMLYFPLVHWYWPQWMPFVAGRQFVFFSPIFNVADSCITVGLFMVILFYGRCLNWGIKGPDGEASVQSKKTKK